MDVEIASTEKEIHQYYHCCGPHFFLYIILITMLVVFAGMTSGLTLGLMSMSQVDLEVIRKSGKRKDRFRASKILPVVKRPHLLLCTLLIAYTAAMEALPLLLQNLLPEYGAILISVTLILLFGEIIPHSICCRYSLKVGAALAPLVHVLLWSLFPVAYPISKLLDFMLGKGRSALFRRAELKTLVSLHGNEAGKGGELSGKETSIISGALELAEKTARDAMTPVSEVFAVDINAKLDSALLHLILENGHSRIPIYHEQPRNIIGLILVKSLLTINPANETPIKNITIRRIPRISEKMPLYDILNEFQEGLSHIALVLRHRSEMAEHSTNSREVRLNIYGEGHHQNLGLRRSRRSLRNLKAIPRSASISRRETSKSKRWSETIDSNILHIDEVPLPSFTKEEEVIGIITMEDVIEQLLKDEIFDEMDHNGEYSGISSSARKVHGVLEGYSGF
ncbi:hypothetical protein ACET3Z_027011 [Daucus carota]